MAKQSSYREAIPGPVKRPGAVYVGSTGAAPVADVPAQWLDTWGAVEWRTYLYNAPSNAIYALLTHVCYVPMPLADVDDGFFWVQTQLHRQFTGTTCIMRLAFYQPGTWTGAQTFQFGFGARAWSDGTLQNQTITLNTQNVTINPATADDRVWYVEKSVTIEGTASARNFLYLRVRRTDNNDVAADLYGISLSVRYSLSGSYVV